MPEEERKRRVMSDPDAIVFIYSTAPSQAEAERLAGAVIEAGQAACVNMLPGMNSIYMWQGELQSESEVALLFKTTQQSCRAAMDTIVRMHPYDTPAVTAFAACDVDPRFAEWVRTETGAETRDKN
ncbi:divalent-cation tolerance protein CutA [Pyruvatibacter sp.]|nr:divalent-cation tolerance protein CutA [Alphaproteobacteria bacterium]